VQLTIRKIIKIVATRCQILGPKTQNAPKSISAGDREPHPTWGAYSWNKGDLRTSKERGRMQGDRIKERECREGRRSGKKSRANVYL